MINPEIDENGYKFWYNELGQLHREDGPAVEYPDGFVEYWYQNDKLHRIDGPAVIWADGHKEYWINDTKYDSLEEFLAKLMDEALQ